MVVTVCFILLVVAAMSSSAGAASLPAYYLPSPCGSTLTLTALSSLSVQLESASGLFYSNNVDCTITINVPSNYLVLASIKRFELEPKRSDLCPDYVNLHDGNNIRGRTLNSEALCGEPLSNTKYISTGTNMTVHFFTDATAVYLGFNIIFTAATHGVCSAEQYACNNSYCIPTQFKCDDYDQCGDLSDEDNCITTTATSSTNWTPLIVGFTLGIIVIALVIAYVIYRLHRNNRWKKFQNEHIEREDIPDPDPSYPVTHRYFRGIRGHPNLNPQTNKTYDATVMIDEKPSSTSSLTSPREGKKVSMSVA